MTYIYRFLARHNLSIRTGSYIGQQFLVNCESLTFRFLHEIIAARGKYGIEPENIINMDETALRYNMPSKKNCT